MLIYLDMVCLIGSRNLERGHVRGDIYCNELKAVFYVVLLNFNGFRAYPHGYSLVKSVSF